jgi:hypothetical protein
MKWAYSSGYLKEKLIRSKQTSRKRVLQRFAEGHKEFKKCYQPRTN